MPAYRRSAPHRFNPENNQPAERPVKHSVLIVVDAVRFRARFGGEATHRILRFVRWWDDVMIDYDDIFRRVKFAYDIRVRRWRTSMTGCAWRVKYSDGRCFNWVECPRIKSPLTLAIFLHEVGHHVIGFERYTLSCEEELHAWRWALCTMRRVGVEPDERTLQRVERSMQYAVSKAVRRGLTTLPQELNAFRLQAA